MPRKAKPPTAEAILAREQLKAYLGREGMALNAFAHMANVPQPTLHRFVSGRTKSVTLLVRRALDYARIKIVVGITPEYDVADDPRLKQALRKACDGRAESIDLLARLIEALSPVLAGH